MGKGPKLNKIPKRFTTRDSLGIESVVFSMQDEICPLVTTVTPRAFYWPFMVWIYYDYHKYSGITEKDDASFDKYLKRQDYFFVLATLLNEGSDQRNLVGKDQTSKDAKGPGPYLYNDKYFKTNYGGMQYYNSGCLSMHFVTKKNGDTEEVYKFPKIKKPEGEEMALAFEEVIKDTEYYKFYRNNEKAVPRKVLEDYGKVIRFDLKGFEKCKSLLKHYMFSDDRNKDLECRSKLLSDCAEYLKIILKENDFDDVNEAFCRGVFYSRTYPSGNKLVIPDEYISVANKWEIVVGRMYFISGIEMIWKFLLEQLDEPLSLNEWVSTTIDNASFENDINCSLSNIIDDCQCGYEEIERIIADTRRKNTSPYSVENGIKVILSVYNKFCNRDDLKEEESFLDKGRGTESISMTEMFACVQEYGSSSIKTFIEFIIKTWIVEQHYNTAKNKALQGRDGFYFEIVNGEYSRRSEFSLDFQGLRMVELKQVMRDLDMI